MEGRWTVVVNHSDEVMGDVRTCETVADDLHVPVVPCDDAAMLRVRLAVQAELRTRTLTPAEIVDIAFRVAGETP